MRMRQSVLLLRPHQIFSHLVLGQRGYLMPWSPVFLSFGIAGFFAASLEPSVIQIAAAAVLALVGAGIALRLDAVAGPVVWALTLVAAGFALAGIRTSHMAAPVLDFRYYGPIEGRVVGLDRSGSGAPRVTLAEVRLARMEPDQIPHLVRLSLLMAEAELPQAGARVMTTGHLSPPGGPTEPGGFDFQRHMWFQGIGAVGYSRVPLLLAAPRPEQSGLLGLRRSLSVHVQHAVGGKAGGLAAAITTGDRSGLLPEVTEALRVTNLAHLLAISGLHMGLLTGFVFAAARLILAMSPMGLIWPVRKIAAALALGVGSVYLALSGGNVATERAFIMVAVAFCAVLLDRRAISLRSVAVAALILLSLRPEALLSPGFQMSFAATVALVAAFAGLTALPNRQMPKWAKPVLAVVVSAAVAGVATLPVAAAHFNRIANYGLIANLVAPPVMGIVVVPSGVLAAVLAPVGLDGVGLWIMAQGLNWIIMVAETVAAWPNPLRYVPAPEGIVLPMLALGGIWVVLIHGRGRWLGVVPMSVACLLWAQTTRPQVLIADTGGLIGVMTEEGRALSKARGAGFIARTWLENDGDGEGQAHAAARWPAPNLVQRIPFAGQVLIHAKGKRALAEVGRCTAGEILIANQIAPEIGPCRILDPKALRRSGSIALWLTPEGVVETHARVLSGRRMWNDRALRRARLNWPGGGQGQADQ